MDEIIQVRFNVPHKNYTGIIRGRFPFYGSFIFETKHGYVMEVFGERRAIYEEFLWDAVYYGWKRKLLQNK